MQLVVDNYCQYLIAISCG